MSFACIGTIHVGPSPIAISVGESLTLDASGESTGTVVLSGGKANRVFVVNGGGLKLVGLTVSEGHAVGATGGNGVEGASGREGAFGTFGDNGSNGVGEGVSGTAGGPGSPGEQGFPASDGTDGTEGFDGQGGAMLIEPGAST